jgi:hypothetical protein
MAKNTSKKNPKRKQNILHKIISSKWYIKLILIIAVGILGFLIFKNCVNTYNISLLDKAETKMRQMDLPKADHTEYKRSCSFRSVKFGGAGSPICDVWRTDIFEISDIQTQKQVAKQYLNIYKEKFPNSKLNYNNDSEFNKNIEDGGDRVPHIYINNIQKGLKCYSRADIDKHDTLNRSILKLTTSCYKTFMFQTYPEINLL